MYTISFEMVTNVLKDNYGKLYINTYFEVRKELRKYKFF
jgi:virulence-associated protein VapD